MEKYIKSPVIVEHILWDGTNENEVIDFCGKEYARSIGVGAIAIRLRPDDKGLKVIHANTAILKKDDNGFIVMPEATFKNEFMNVDNMTDGYHSFNELYEYRKLYNALAFNLMANDPKFNVVKSKRHSDGEECFGGGWFIVVATLPGSGQISNHYELKDWNLFKCKEVELAPKWDGHTPEDVENRIKAYIMTGVPNNTMDLQ